MSESSEQARVAELTQALKAASNALYDARDGLDYGLAGWRKVDGYHEAYDAGTPNCARAAGYLNRARAAHREVKAALDSEAKTSEPTRATATDEQRARVSCQGDLTSMKRRIDIYVGALREIAAAIPSYSDGWPVPDPAELVGVAATALKRGRPGLPDEREADRDKARDPFSS